MHKLVMKKMKGFHNFAPTERAKLESIISSLFPSSPVSERRFDLLLQDVRSPVQISTDEVVEAAKDISNDKAPGPDGIPNRAVKLPVGLLPKVFAQLFSTCLSEGTLPQC